MWLQRFEDLLPLRSRGAFHLYSARDQAERNEPVVLVVPAPRVERGAARAALGQLESAHESLRNECDLIETQLAACLLDVIPAVELLDGFEQPIALVHCPAVTSFEALAEQMAFAGPRLPYVAATHMERLLLQVLSGAEALGRTGGPPVQLGGVGGANVLFATDGRPWVLGFGFNVCLLRESGQPFGFNDAHFAPEVAAGAAPSAGADLYALTQFLRSLIALVELPQLASEIFAGEGAALAGPIRAAEHFSWASQHILAAPAKERASAAQALDRLEQVWAELGVCPDRERCEAYFAELIRSESEPDAGEHLELRDAVVLGPEASWVVNPDGVKHNLGSRASLRRILEALAKQRVSGNVQALSVGDLIAAGWPDESPIFEAGANRVYVAVSTLRKLGLRDVIERYSGGYRLSPEVAVRFSAGLAN
ncbi:MAG: hypothetical protein R3B07_00605 [Polyangiaceae bacterium]